MGRRRGDRARGGRRFNLWRQALRLAQLIPARLIPARAQEGVEIDGRTLRLLPLGEMSGSGDGGRTDRPGPSNENATHDPSDGIADRIHDATEPITLRGRTKIRRHGVGSSRNAPDKQGLAEIARLLRQSGWRSEE